jgi:heme exporter protein D
MNMHDFFSMGGYGVYVWTSYATTFFVFILNIVLSLREKKQIKKLIRSYYEC